MMEFLYLISVSFKKKKKIIVKKYRNTFVKIGFRFEILHGRLESIFLFPIARRCHLINLENLALHVYVYVVIRLYRYFNLDIFCPHVYIYFFLCNTYKYNYLLT